MSSYAIDKDRVQDIMKKANISTQQDLANKMGITKNQLSVILSSKNNPFKSNIQLLCDILNISPIEIVAPSQEIEERKTAKVLSYNFITHENMFIDINNIVAARPYTVLELFAGAGGLALGLHKAGFKAVGLVENDKYAATTLRNNMPSWNVIEEDIVKVAANGIFNYIDKNIEVDLISGGYPCQSFSYAGQKKGLDDVRGTMFYYFSKVLEQIKPKVFLAENVRGLKSHDNGRTLETMINIFREIGYAVEYHVIKATDYNVAQKRERLIIVGIRNDITVNYKLPKPFDHKPTLKDALEGVPKSEGSKYPEGKRNILEKIPPGGYWRDLPDAVAKQYMGKSYYSGGGRTGMARRISWDEPCLTLTCSPAQKQTERCHPEETRPFTVREYARIQSFPDHWDFYGSLGQKYKQIGNAVPVEMAKAIGLSLINVLNQNEK